MVPLAECYMCGWVSDNVTADKLPQVEEDHLKEIHPEPNIVVGFYEREVLRGPIIQITTVSSTINPGKPNSKPVLVYKRMK